MIRSSVVTDQGDQQLIYEAYSNVCFQSLLSSTRAFSPGIHSIN